MTTRRLYFLPARRHVFSAGKNDDSKTKGRTKKEPGVLVRRGAEDDWTRTCGRRNRACKHTPGHANTHQGRPRTTTLQAEGTRTRPRTTLQTERSARELQGQTPHDCTPSGGHANKTPHATLRTERTRTPNGGHTTPNKNNTRNKNKSLRQTYHQQARSELIPIYVLLLFLAVLGLVVVYPPLRTRKRPTQNLRSRVTRNLPLSQPSHRRQRAGAGRAGAV